jgi:hypothetical protein
MTSSAEQWRSTFFETIRQHQHVVALQDASRQGHLGQWTRLLTEVVVSTCRALGWQASAKGHKLQLLPVSRHEYLSQDVMAFVEAGPRWAFPVAVMELGLVHSSAADSPMNLIVNRLRQDGEIEDAISPNFLVRNWPPAFKEWSTCSAR